MLKVIELFAGIGSQTQALKNVGVQHEVVGISEIDKYAIQAYEAIHGKVNNFGDITKINELPYCDLLTYSFPCQSISVSGKQEGLSKDSGTRSGLLWEVERLVEGAKERPKYLLLENVKNLVSKKFKPDFELWLKRLEELGYNNYWQVLNAKDYGTPQNRERVFVVSIRKDIDTKGYTFPEKQELKLRLKDILEDSVDEKFYISNEKTNKLLETLKFKSIKKSNNILQIGSFDKEDINDNERQRRVFSTEGISPTVLARADNAKIIQVGMLDMRASQQIRSVYDKEGICPTIDTMQGGHRQPKVLIDKSIKPSVAINFEREKDIYQAKCDSGWQDNKIGLKISQTIRANNNFHPCLDNNYRIRKLTPLECWRLMGFKDEEFYKAKNAGISNTQLYKMAGNSIVVNVLEAIFKQMDI